MLERIKEDVDSDLKSIIEEHNDIFYKYEISDDFKLVYLYETPNGSGKSVFFDLRPGTLSRIKSLIALYHSIKEGRTVGIHQAVKFIEIGDVVE